MKLEGKTTKEIMTELNIRSESQVYTVCVSIEGENFIDSHKVWANSQ